MEEDFDMWKQEVLDTLKTFSMKSLGAAKMIDWDDWKVSYFNQEWSPAEAIYENRTALYCEQ